MTAALTPVRDDTAELAGWADTVAAAPADLVAARGILHTEHDGAHLTAVTSLPGRLTNHLLGLREGHGPGGHALREAERLLHGHRVPVFVGLPEGSALEAGLRARGYVPDGAWTAFTRPADPAPPVTCDLAIRRVPPQDAERLGGVVAGAFELPDDLGPWFGALVGRAGWHCLGAYDGGELVATGSLFAQGDAGWLTWGATSRGHRGRGAQKALLAARVEVARELGLRRLLVETGDLTDDRPHPSHRNILAAGFRPAYRRCFWRRDPPAP